MNLSHQMALRLGIILVVLAAVFSILSWTLFSPAFGRLEESIAERSLRCMRGFVDEQVVDLQGSIADWAVWDETRQFALGVYPGYLDSNLVTTTLERLRLDLFIVMDTRDSLLAIVGSGSTGFTPPDSDLALLCGPGTAISEISDSPAGGLAWVGGRPAAVAIHPILPTSGQGESAGNLVFVRYLDGILRASPFEMHGIVTTLLPVTPGGDGGILFTRVSRDLMTASSAIPVLAGSPMTLSVSMDRVISSGGHRILLLINLFTALCGLVFSLCSLVVVRQLIVSRLSVLLSRLGAGQHHGIDTDRDELESVHQAVEPLLARIESLTERLRSQEEQNQAVISAVPDFMVTLDRAGTILSVHAGYGNYEAIPPGEMIGRSALDFALESPAPSSIGSMIERVLDTGLVERFEIVLTIEGQPRTYDASMVSLGGDRALVVIRDTTQKKRIEAESARIERLESLGLLAGGIAHDFNNCLAAVLGSLDLALLPSSADRISGILDRARRACDSARTLTQKLLTFSAGGDPVLERVEVPALVRDTVESQLSGTGIHLETDFPPDLWKMLADREQMIQVVRNITANAVEAMGGSGTLTVSARNWRSDPTVPSLGPGRYVNLTIRDTGAGIPHNRLSRIFEPYYTTKPDAQGLGLSVCHSVVRRHGGHIEAHSSTQGAEFRIWIPAAEPLPEQQRHDAAGAARIPVGGRVLLMDDDPVVLETVGEMLQSFGMSVVPARDGSEVLSRMSEAARTGRPFDLLFLDLVIPGGIGGVEVLARVRRQYGTFPAVVFSGYSADSVLADYRAHGFSSVLKKPFGLEELKSAITAALAAGPGRSQG
jgi:signal transduction histidine kinase/sensor domain CHASE-containing protein/ActR/RegA family two-component response regulator